MDLSAWAMHPLKRLRPEMLGTPSHSYEERESSFKYPGGVVRMSAVVYSFAGLRIGRRPSTIGDMRTEASPPNVLTYAQASDVVRSHAAQISTALPARQEVSLLDSRGRVLAV